MTEKTARTETTAILPDVAVVKKLISFRTLLVSSFWETWHRPGLVVSILAAFVGVMFVSVLIIGFFSAAFLQSWFISELSWQAMLPLFIAVLVFVVLLMLAYVALGTAIVHAALKRQQQVSYWQSVYWALHHVWPIIGIVALKQLTTTTGYVLFILPGILLSLYISFSMFAYITEGTKGMTALLRSIDIIYGRFWKIAWRLVAFVTTVLFAVVVPLMIVVVMVSDIVPLLGLALLGLMICFGYPFIVVWLLFGVARLYESAVELAPYEQFDSVKYRRLKNVLIVMTILGVPLFLGWNMFSLLF